MVLGQVDIHMKNDEFSCVPHTIYKNELRMIMDLNVRAETMKLVEEKIGENLEDFRLVKDYLGI